jgi:hypothetical protein
MKKTCCALFICLSVLAFLPQPVIAKGPTTPNVSVIYAIEAIAAQLPALPTNQQVSKQEPLLETTKTTFQTLFGVNQNLALEAGRLPAFQKDVKEKDTLALARFTELVGRATPEQKSSLEALLSIGLKEFRRYSAPLEAIFWVLEKGDYDPNKPLLQLPVEEILDQSWDFSDRTRWGDYETVTERLNAPELVNYYQRIRVIYESKAGRRDAFTGDARNLFESNIGNCYDNSEFAAYCLEKAGYKTSVVGVHPSQPRYHVVCRYESGEKSYFLDNGRPDKFLRRGIIPKEEYEMYHEKENIRKGESTKDPVYLIQDNHGLVLVYLMDQKEKVASVKNICKSLGLSGYEEKVKNEYLPALIDSGFITKPTPSKGGGSEDFEYSMNEALCERLKTARYHRPQNAAQKW